MARAPLAELINNKYKELYPLPPYVIWWHKESWPRRGWGGPAPRRIKKEIKDSALCHQTGRFAIAPPACPATSRTWRWAKPPAVCRCSGIHQNEVESIKIIWNPPNDMESIGMRWESMKIRWNSWKWGEIYGNQVKSEKNERNSIEMRGNQ